MEFISDGKCNKMLLAKSRDMDTTERLKRFCTTIDPTNTSLHAKENEGYFLGIISAVLMFGMKEKLKRAPRVFYACGNISVMPECSNQ